MIGRLFVCAAGLLAAVAGLAWLRAEAPAGLAGPALDPDQPCALIVDSPQTTIDLHFTPGRRYVLIVSSLGRSERSYPVRLTAEPVGRAEFAPLAGLPPLADARHERSGSRQTSDIESLQGVGGIACDSDLACDIAPAERHFHLHVADLDLENPRGYTLVAAQNIAEGRCARIYLDAQLSAADLAPGLATEIVRLLDDEIVLRSRELLGVHHDIDG